MTLAELKEKHKKIMFWLVSGLILLILLLIDLVSKMVVVDVFNVEQGRYFLGIVRLYATMNPGIAFGIASDNRALMVVITVLTVVMIGAIAALFFTVFKKNKPVQAMLAVIEAGAVGNLLDRLCLGQVRDFIDVRPLGFGICNIADFYITFGAVVLLLFILFIGKHAVFPLKKAWREEAKAEEEAKRYDKS